MIRKLVCVLTLAWISTICCPTPATALEKTPTGSTVRFGILFDDQSSVLAESFLILEQHIRELLAGEYEPVFERRLALGDDPTFAVGKARLEELLADPEVDLILTVGYLSSTAALHMGPLAKPTLAPYALNAQMQGLEPTPTGGSGIRNLCYLSAPEIVTTHVEVLYRIRPFRKLAVMGPPTMLELNPDWQEDMVRYHIGSDLEIVHVPLVDDIAASLAAIPEDVEAVSLLTSSLDLAQIRELADGLIARGLPSFSFVGMPDVERGILACLRTDEESDRFARRIAMNFRRVLSGTEPAALPVSFSLDSRLVINQATARAIGADLPWELRLEAQFIDDQPPSDMPVLCLRDVLNEALLTNLGLKTQQEAVTAGEQTVKLARANKLPQLQVGARGLVIDQDRAAAGLGNNAERTYTASATVTQLLYDDKAWANHTINGHLQEQREQQYEQFRLDLVLETATAYLNLLRAQTLEFIQRDNLQLSLSNLQQARFREKIGVAGPGEVFRWEAKIAQDRNNLIQANSQRNLAEIQLNRLLNRPLEDEVFIQDIQLDSEDIGLHQSWINRGFTEPTLFRATREWIALQAINNSPELQALDAAIAAQERALSSANRAYYLPTIALQGNFDHVLDRTGVGADGMNLDPASIPASQQDAAQFFSTVLGETPDDNNWSIGLSLSLPLFEGGFRRAQQLKSRHDLILLQRQHAAVSEQIAQSARSVTHIAGATFANLQHSRDAADAATRTLDLIQDAYSQGAADLLDLLDAQNASLVSEQMAANAVYDFLLDYLRIERSLCRFDLLMSDDQKNRERQQFEDFLADN